MYLTINSIFDIDIIRIQVDSLLLFKLTQTGVYNEKRYLHP